MSYERDFTFFQRHLFKGITRTLNKFFSICFTVLKCKLETFQCTLKTFSEDTVIDFKVYIFDLSLVKNFQISLILFSLSHIHYNNLKQSEIKSKLIWKRKTANKSEPQHTYIPVGGGWGWWILSLWRPLVASIIFIFLKF